MPQRKRPTISHKSGSDSESSAGKRTKTGDKSIENKSKADDIIENIQKNDDISEDVPQKPLEDSPKEQEVIKDTIETREDSDYSQKELLIDFDVSEEMEITVGETVSKPETIVNGKPPQVESCDNEKQSTELKNCLFCIFCEKVFWTVNETKTHYVSHLCPLKCSKCKQVFSAYHQYLSHDCGHPKTPDNIEWCRQYSDCFNWIEKFLDYQQMEEIESFSKLTSNHKCIVCEKLEQLRPESSQGKKEINISEVSAHLEKHLKYSSQYQCLFCLLNHDKYYYCRNSGEAEQHLLKEHSSHESNGNALQYFDGSIPKLDEMIHPLNP